MQRFGFFVVIGALGLMLSGCAAESGETSEGESGDELTSSSIETLPVTLTPGSASVIEFTPTAARKYGALKFVVGGTAPKDRAIFATVRPFPGSSVKPFGWVLNSTKRNVIPRESADATNRVSLFAELTSNTATYYVAFRDAGNVPGKYIVTLQTGCGDTLGEGYNASCDAEPLAKSVTPPPAKPYECDGAAVWPSVTTKFTDMKVETYERTCDAAAACTAWTLKTSQVLYGSYFSSSYFEPTTRSLSSSPIVYSWSTTSGSSTYNCKRWWEIDGTLGTNGLGTSTRHKEEYLCNISGGSGGPYGTTDLKPFALKLGNDCLSATREVPAPKANETQTVTTVKFR